MPVLIEMLCDNSANKKWLEAMVAELISPHDPPHKPEIDKAVLFLKSGAPIPTELYERGRGFNDFKTSLFRLIVYSRGDYEKVLDAVLEREDGRNLFQSSVGQFFNFFPDRPNVFGKIIEKCPFLMKEKWSYQSIIRDNFDLMAFFVKAGWDLTQPFHEEHKQPPLEFAFSINADNIVLAALDRTDKENVATLLAAALVTLLNSYKENYLFLHGRTQAIMTGILEKNPEILFLAKPPDLSPFELAVKFRQKELIDFLLKSDQFKKTYAPQILAATYRYSYPKYFSEIYRKLQSSMVEAKGLDEKQSLNLAVIIANQANLLGLMVIRDDVETIKLLYQDFPALLKDPQWLKPFLYQIAENPVGQIAEFLMERAPQLFANAPAAILKKLIKDDDLDNFKKISATAPDVFNMEKWPSMIELMIVNKSNKIAKYVSQMQLKADVKEDKNENPLAVTQRLLKQYPDVAQSEKIGEFLKPAIKSDPEIFKFMLFLDPKKPINWLFSPDIMLAVFENKMFPVEQLPDAALGVLFNIILASKNKANFEALILPPTCRKKIEAFSGSHLADAKLGDPKLLCCALANGMQIIKPKAPHPECEIILQKFNAAKEAALKMKPAIPGKTPAELALNFLKTVEKSYSARLSKQPEDKLIQDLTQLLKEPNLQDENAAKLVKAEIERVLADPKTNEKYLKKLVCIQIKIFSPEMVEQLKQAQKPTPR